MARIGFLSHSDMSLYFFRAPIMRALKKEGHEVFAIAPDGEFIQKLSSEFKIKTYELDKASINPFKVIQNSNSLAKTLASLNLDMLQTSAHKSNVFGTFAAKKAGIAVIINLVEGLGSYYIDTDFKSRFVKFVMENLYKKAFKLSDACIFVNDSDPNYFIEKKIIDKTKVVRIKSVGIDTKEFSPSKFENSYLSDKKVVLMVARALWHKGIKEFYEAAEILKDRKDVEFVFVGDFDEGNKSSANKEFLTSPYVKWLGFRSNIAELLKASYVFVLPSYKEGFPRTILEAMAMAKPSVATNVSGCVEAVKDGVTGLICEVRNSRDLARKIEILLDDEHLTYMMGQNARKLAIENYDERKIVKKYLDFYKRFI